VAPLEAGTTPSNRIFPLEESDEYNTPTEKDNRGRFYTVYVALSGLSSTWANGIVIREMSRKIPVIWEYFESTLAPNILQHMRIISQI
jgi:hypothetical protein